MRKLHNNRRINRGLLFITLAISSCSNEYNQEIADNINIEFELTYLYVVENLPIKDDYSEKFFIFKKLNKDAFTSIAYTWHKISLDSCELNNSNSRKSNKTSYEKMLNNSPSNSNLSKTVMDTDRPCLANIYFDNWSNIQNMLLLSYPEFK
jgi:hypothetical protein|tara:strand:+ start:105 stop:557 length:453 start_codon:yes stop_codon:yes gene_type:complete